MKNLSLFLVLFFAEILVFGNMSDSQVKALNNSNGLVAWYPFNANANDESGNGNNGTVNGAVLSKDQSGMNDQAYQFDGISNYISVPNNPTIVLTNELSLTAWVKRTRFGIDMILEKGGDWTYGNCNYGMSLHSINNNMFYFFFNGGWRGTDGVNDFEWHHYAVVAKNGDINPLLYIDGQKKTVQYSEGAATINLKSSTDDLHIGAQLNPSYFGANVIDNIRIYNTLLSQVEISILASKGIVAYYPFNGNANDESGNGHNGTVSGATITTDRYNLTGKAYNFIYNGFSSDKIEVPGTSDLNFSTTGFTLSAWVKFSGTAGAGNNYPVISKHICGEQSGYILMLYNSKLTFWLAGSGGYNVVSTSEDYTDNSWHQVTSVYDGITQFIYVDGVLKNSIAFSYNIFNAANLALGGYNGCNGGFNGKVDEVKIFNLPLTAEEILLDYNRSKINLVAYFPFNGNANDESGNGNNPTYIGSGVTLTSDRFGHPDKAYYFDGNTDSYIRIPADKFPTTDRTISFWFNADQLNNHPTPLSYGGETCNNSLLMIINKGGYPNAYTVLSHCGANFITAPYSEAPVNKWYYLTMTISGSTQKIFINGELQHTEDSFTTPTVVAGKSAILGALLFTDGYTVYVDPSAGNFQGKLDDFRFYNTSMTDAEVRALYTSEAFGLVANYPFDGNADDVSGNQNHGIVNNAILTSDRYGVADKAFAFNGIDSYIEGANPGNNLPAGNSSRSFVAWEKDYTYHQWGSNIFHYGTPEVAPTNIHFLITDVLGLGNGYGYGVTYGNTNLIDSTWHFVCGTYDSTNQMVKLFVDGRLDNSGALSTPPNTVLAANWRIGLFMGGGTPMNGKLDEIRVFKTVLTNQEIQYMYSNETTAPTLQQPVDRSSIATLTPTMQWSSILTGAEFRFQLSSDSLFTTLLQDVTTTNQSTQIPEGILSEGVNYFWRIRTTVNRETGPWSSSWKFTFLNTGLNQPLSNIAILNITPNPADNWLNIYYTVQAKNASRVPVNIEILNSIGLSIFKTVEKSMIPGNYELKVATSSLQPGIYYCRLMAGNNSVVRKLVILH